MNGASKSKTFDQLADELTRDLRPVRRLTGPLRSTFVLLAAALFTAAVVVLLFGLRPAAPTDGDYASYMVSEVGCLAGALMLAFATSSARVPGASLRKTLWLAGVLLLLTTIGLVTFAIHAQDTNVVHHVEAGWHCTERALLLAIPSILVATLFVRRGAPVSKVRAGVSVAGLAVAISAAALPFVCDSSAGLHLLLAHLLIPLSLATLVVTAGSRWLFRW